MKIKVSGVLNTTGRLEITREMIEDSQISNPNNLNSVATKIIELEEKVVREALIKLGWTPPGEK